MNPNAEESHRILGLTLALQGQLQEAERVLRDALTLPGAGAYARATLGWVLARSRKRTEAEQLLRGLEAEAREGYVSPVAFATLHLALGDVDRAMEYTERAWEERRGWLAYLAVNQMFDSVRGDPRFQALVARMKV
jgi:serine/threonine-protein kinase